MYSEIHLLFSFVGYVVVHTSANKKIFFSADCQTVNLHVNKILAVVFLFVVLERCANVTSSLDHG